MLDLKDRIASRKDKEIFALIRKQGIVSKTELMEQCGMTASTIGHLVVGTIAFAALIAANFVAGHHYSRTGQARLARGSRLAGAVFLAGDLYSTAGGYAGPLVLAVTVLVAMGWLGVVAAVERRR